MSNKVIIEVRINEYTMRDANPNVPYSPAEIATQALQCWREGASIIHYHARDPHTGAPASDPQLYADTVRRIKEQSDLISMPTLGAWWMPSPQDRIAHINVGLVARIAQLARDIGREIATPAEARQMLGLGM